MTNALSIKPNLINLAILAAMAATILYLLQ
jgi:hypothetical protein